METLKTLLEKHPEWADLPIGVGRPDGYIDYVGEAGSAYTFGGEDLSDEERRDMTEELGRAPIETLVFEAN